MFNNFQKEFCSLHGNYLKIRNIRSIVGKGHFFRRNLKIGKIVFLENK